MYGKQNVMVVKKLRSFAVITDHDSCGKVSNFTGALWYVVNSKVSVRSVIHSMTWTWKLYFYACNTLKTEERIQVSVATVMSLYHFCMTSLLHQLSPQYICVIMWLYLQQFFSEANLDRGQAEWYKCSVVSSSSILTSRIGYNRNIYILHTKIIYEHHISATCFAILSAEVNSTFVHKLWDIWQLKISC